MDILRLGSLEISPFLPPLVIAEIGINHGGSLDVAKKMVDAAHHAGCQCIKHQTHIIDDEMSPAAKNVIPGNANISIYDIMESCALSEDDEYALKQYVESKGMLFLSTPFSRAAANRLQKFAVAAFKIGSGECNNYPLLKHIAAFGKPVILSTGMNDIDSIRKATAIFHRHGIPFALLHTTNLYPTPPRLVRLGAMRELMSAFEGTPIGLSDHTLNNNACIAAVALGACIVERHFTDDKNRSGPDIACSMDGWELAQLIAAVTEVHAMRGGHKEADVEEKVTMDFAFATVVAILDIKRGEKLAKDNIWVKRPGTGQIPAEHYESLLGKTAVRDIAAGSHLNYSEISP
jgi:Sialic acid synthase